MLVHLELSDQIPNEWVPWCLHHHYVKLFISHSADTCLSAVSRAWKGLSFENEWFIPCERKLQILCLFVLFCLKPILVAVTAPKEFLWLKSFIFLLNWECCLCGYQMSEGLFYRVVSKHRPLSSGPHEGATTSQLGYFYGRCQRTWHNQVDILWHRPKDTFFNLRHGWSCRPGSEGDWLPWANLSSLQLASPFCKW